MQAEASAMFLTVSCHEHHWTSVSRYEACFACKKAQEYLRTKSVLVYKTRVERLLAKLCSHQNMESGDGWCPDFCTDELMIE